MSSDQLDAATMAFYALLRAEVPERVPEFDESSVLARAWRRWCRSQLKLAVRDVGAVKVGIDTTHAV